MVVGVVAGGRFGDGARDGMRFSMWVKDKGHIRRRQSSGVG